jgi:hypothetical protein
MKIIILFLVLSLAGCQTTSYQRPKPYQPHPSNGETITEKFLVIGNSYLYFGLFKPKLYILKGQYNPSFFTDKIFQILLYSDNSGYGHKDTKGFYSINGKAEKLKLTPTKDSNTTIDYHHTEDSWYVYNLGSNDIEFNFSIAGKNKKIILDVIKLPLTEGASTDELIQTLGLPTSKKEKYASWPCTEFVNGIRYEPIAGQGGIAIKQWFYDKYPSLIVDVTSSKIKVYTLGSQDRTFSTCG